MATCFGVLLWIGFDVMRSEKILQVTAGMDLSVAIFVAGAVILAYTAMGGLKAVIYTVAIKVLPEHVAHDPDLRERFEREGETLAARLAERGALALDEVLRYVIEIAEALDKAHGVSITHRGFTNGGRQPVWSRDGRELFYRNADQMMAVAIETDPELTVGVPKRLFDCQSFLMI